MRKWIAGSFRNRILASVLLFTILPLLLSSGLVLEAQIYRSNLERENQAAQELAACRERLETYCTQVETICSNLAESTAVRSVLRRNNRDSRILYQVLLRQTGQLREFAWGAVYLADGTCGYSTGTPLEAELNPNWGILLAAAQSEGMVYRRLEKNGGEGFSAARAVRDAQGEILGYILFAIDRKGLDTLLDGSVADSENLLLLTQFWQPLYGTRPSDTEADALALRNRLLEGRLSNGFSNGNRRIWVESASNGRFFLILQQPVFFTAGILHSFLGVGLGAGAVCVILCVAYALWLSGNLAAPVHRMEQAMERVEQGDLTVRLEENREDELGKLSQSFNRMIQEYQENLERSVRNQRELNETRIRMMQAQLNPHFLYNTLDSVKWLGVTHQVPDVAKLSTDLAELLRVSVSAREFLTVEQELEMVERYVEIQEIRFFDRFTCEIDVEEQFQSCYIPKMVLQPLVENAIIHGVADMEEGYIKISAVREETDMLLQVEDNGCGIPDETVQTFLKNRRTSHVPEGHLGLYNVDEILRLYYGENYGVGAKRLETGGSCVWLRIPMEKTEKGGDALC